MNKHWVNILICALIGLPVSLVCPTINLGQEKGSIRGTVVDDRGSPLSKARVHANALDGRPRGALIRYVETDENGRFIIDRLEWGKYAIFAMKEESEYPDLGASLYSNDIFPTVTIVPQTPLADLRIQLGPKAGILTGSVVDATNGGPLNARFKLTRAAAPDKWLSTSAPPNYRLLLPSSTDVLIEVAAPGFKTWTPAGPLQLHPGEELRLDISLEPSHDPNLHPSKFLVPAGYIGWLLLEYNVKGAEPSPNESGLEVFRFPVDGILKTASTGPQRGAQDMYLYYSVNGSVQEIPTDYKNGKAMIWGQHEGTANGILSQFGFFVGSEEQYKKYQMRETHPGPISSP
jgi:hypothetical protein